MDFASDFFDLYTNVKVHLSVTPHINCIDARCLINVVYLTAYAFMMALHFLNDVANDAESTQK